MGLTVAVDRGVVEAVAFDVALQIALLGVAENPLEYVAEIGNHSFWAGVELASEQIGAAVVVWTFDRSVFVRPEGDDRPPGIYPA